MSRFICILVVAFLWGPQGTEAVPQEIEKPVTENPAAAEDTSSDDERLPQILLVKGAGGTPAWTEQIAASAIAWQLLAAEENLSLVTLGPELPDRSPREQLADALAESSPDRALWIVLLGHGTWDGRKARFNLVGPDVSARELAEWMAELNQSLVVIHCGSSSAPFIDRLSGANRTVITATRSGDQSNATRFGTYLGPALADLANDLDKDRQVSLLEAFVAASARTQEFYTTEQRLATELALLDDNGDGRGTPADWFSGTRATRTARDARSPDGARANRLFLKRSPQEQTLSRAQREIRDRLETEIESLRGRRTEIDEGVYLDELETRLIELARLYQSAGD